jgi:phage terminase large subunit-like protein
MHGLLEGGSLYERLAQTLSGSWRLQARPEQLAPAGDWATWLVLAGRGWGKTRTGAEWVTEQVLFGRAGRIALVAPTASDARDVMVEGESGILAIAPDHMRPIYEPSKRRLTWPNGAIASTYSADEPDRLRGPQHDAAWADEIAAWGYPAAWDMLRLGLRLGTRPQCLASTTPKPVKLIRDLLSREGQGVVVTRGRTADNAANLAPDFLAEVERLYGGTRLGRQELDGEFLADTPGALWTRDAIDRDRVSASPELVRIVVAIDPAVSNNDKSDETGIIAAGLDRIGHINVLADVSGRYRPNEWAQKAIDLFAELKADRIVAEVNNGGQMVEATLASINKNIPFKALHASRGKVIRAEPVSALYEQRKVHHVGIFNELEDQMSGFTIDFDRNKAGYSPDRVDALVWAITELAGRPAIPVAQTGSFSGHR